MPCSAGQSEKEMERQRKATNFVDRCRLQKLPFGTRYAQVVQATRVADEGRNQKNLRAL